LDAKFCSCGVSKVSVPPFEQLRESVSVFGIELTT
jgi:hypothetical protein